MTSPYCHHVLSINYVFERRRSIALCNNHDTRFPLLIPNSQFSNNHISQNGQQGSSVEVRLQPVPVGKARSQVYRSDTM